MFKDKVIQLLNEADFDVKSALFNQDFTPEFNRWDSDEDIEFKTKLQSENIIVEQVDHHGGEGEGEEYWTVWSFSNANEVVYIKFDGTYMSYDGSTYDEFYEVQAVERLVTFYERKA